MPFNIESFKDLTKEGFAREAHFEAILSLPKSISNPDASETTSLSSIRQPGTTSSDQVKKLSLLCSAATLPGRRISTTTVNRFGQGFRQSFATGTQYDALSLEFYCDARAENLKLLHLWMDSIFSFDVNTYQQVEYSDNYTAPMTLLQYNTQGETIAEWYFEEIFPEALPPVNFSWAARGSFIIVQAIFSYAKYQQLATPKTQTAVSDSFKKAQNNRLPTRSIIPL